MGNAKNKKIIKKTEILGKSIAWILFVVVVVRLVWIILPMQEKFFSPGYSKTFNSFKNLYQNSQYVKKQNPIIIPDETFNSYAAGAFLKGLNPILIVHDHPPLGRYIFSLSILLLDNVNFFIPVSLFFSLLGIFLIARLLYKSTLIALLPVVLFCWEPLFYNQFLYTPLLEPLQLPFILFCVYFFLRALVAKKSAGWFVLCSLMLGFVISIRFFIVGLVLLFALVVTLLLYRRIKQLLIFIPTLFASLIVLFLSYTKTMLDGSPPLHIFGIQKYMFVYHKSQFISPLSFWDLLLFNRWHTWWGNFSIAHDSQWIILWPLAMVSSVLLVVWLLWKKSIQEGEVLIILWIFFYCSLLSIGNTATRYFIPFIPFTYIFMARLLSLLFEEIKKRFSLW